MEGQHMVQGTDMPPQRSRIDSVSSTRRRVALAGSFNHFSYQELGTPNKESSCSPILRFITQRFFIHDHRIHRARRPAFLHFNSLNTRLFNNLHLHNTRSSTFHSDPLQCSSSSLLSLPLRPLSPRKMRRPPPRPRPLQALTSMSL